MLINPYGLLACITNAVDLVSPELATHHQQVGYMAYRIAERLYLPVHERRDILIAGMLHDIGALTLEERLELLESEPQSVNNHAFRGAKLMESIEVLHSVSASVRYHHISWENGRGAFHLGHEVPIAAHIIHLADRVCVITKKRGDVLTQVPFILKSIQEQSGSVFLPEFADSLAELGRIEHIWHELISRSPLEYLHGEMFFQPVELSDVQIESFTRMMSYIIDFRSHFTATHSAGVAATAVRLGELAGFSDKECRALLIAGYLHDLGKLAIPSSLLEKPSALDEREFNIIRSHTFYTHQLLGAVAGFDTVSKWAAYHHEKLNGNGYPFHLHAPDIPLGSRIMAVADVFTSIAEPRPYRRGMERDEILQVLHSMIDNGSICPEVVRLLLEHFDEITALCFDSQQEAARIYSKYLESFE